MAAPCPAWFCVMRDPMKLRTRKAIGTVLTVIWLTVYSLVMMAIGGILVLGRGMVLELPFYIIAGLGWVPVEMWIIRWMSKPDPVGEA